MKYLKLLTVPVVLIALSYGCQKTTYVPPPPAPKVNAGANQTITLPVDSVKLSGSAYAPTRITGYLWSEVSGPNTPTIADNGNATTEVNGLVAGIYVFQLEATDSAGETGVNSVTITVNPISKIVHTDTLHTSFSGMTWPYELTFLSNPASPAGNNRDIELLAETWTINGIEVWGRSFMKFDVSSLPAGTTLKSATLYLFSDSVPRNGDLIHANYGTNNDFYIQKVTSTWNLDSTTWNNLPSTDTTGEAYVPQTNLPFLDIQVDVTQIANSWLTNANYGLVMRLKTEVIYNSRIFCTSNYSNPAKHPYLVVTY
ncbi:DNRLRE domain-containing protein [Puia dinghuensis]|uniref:Carbohydrate-binding module family 96 domain-containing protein n=1 Tax=Puia dinghuensis TaxID=1792502 RepID=A0A8J2XU53_9BACT|nr:DNRLRE domain-containing protein [Puia dinghuensis]GGB07985.1 hypothetical protein GCM10011511_34380 [Puia dinghuensis]